MTVTCVFPSTEARGACSKGRGSGNVCWRSKQGKEGRKERMSLLKRQAPARLHAPCVLGRPHTIIQHKVPLDGKSLVLGRQTGWTRGDQAMGSLSFRRAMSLDMKFLKFS